MAGIPLPGFSLPIPFTVIDETYSGAFKVYLETAVGAVQSTVAGPLLTCVTIWVIVQGVLVMRGDIDPRRGLTKLISVAIVVGLVSSSTLYYQPFVVDLFETIIPKLVSDLGGNFHLPTDTIPVELDGIFRLGQGYFIGVSAAIPEMDTLDSLAYEGAQFVFFFTLWSMFGIYDVVSIMTSVLVALGPLFIIGFLFEATKGITTRWIGQLISYAILLLLVSIVEAGVIGVIALAMASQIPLLLGIGKGVAGATTTAKILGLFELDLFILTGNALVVALPGIAAMLGGGVAAQGIQMGQSIGRHFGGKPSPETIRQASFYQ